MIPLHDDNPTRHPPYLTIAIVALNVIAFLLWQPTFATGRDSEVKQVTFFYCNALIPWEITHQVPLAQGGAEARRVIDEEQPLPGVSGRDLQAHLREHCPDKVWWYSLFVAMFLHGGWLHIGGNMLFLWVFGNNLEDKLRPALFLLFYLAAGIAASFAQIATNSNSVVPNLGASGAVAGVLGAYILMFPRRRVLTLVFFFFITMVYLPAFVVLGMWFVLQLFSGVASLTPAVRGGGGGVAFWAHIGGFVFGSVMALLFFPKERLGGPAPPPPREWHGRRVRGWGSDRGWNGRW